MVPLPHGHAYAEGIPNAKGLEVIEGAGHSVHVEKPDATAQLFLAFLKAKTA